jgi:hypothetical protein
VPPLEPDEPLEPDDPPEPDEPLEPDDPPEPDEPPEPDDPLEPLPLPLSLDELELPPAPLSPELFDSGLLDAYRSLYQPPPLSVKAVREISRSRAGFPQTSQTSLSGSAIRCWYSNSRSQALHLYS